MSSASNVDDVYKLIGTLKIAVAEGGVADNDKDDLMAQAADALEATLPEEREGRCWCGSCRRTAGYWRIDVVDGGTEISDEYCQHCGAHLCADGIARRNADSARVERVTAELHEMEVWASSLPAPLPVAHYVDDLDKLTLGDEQAAESVRNAIKRIRAALDGPQDAAQEDPAPPDPRTMLDWLYARGVCVCDARCEPDARPEDMCPKWWDGLGSWEYPHDKTEFLRRIGVGIQWEPCDDVTWARSALEWLRQGGIRVRGGEVDWRASEPQGGTEFYCELSADTEQSDTARLDALERMSADSADVDGERA